MPGKGGDGQDTSALQLGLLSALKTGNRTLDLFIVALLPTVIALVAASSERLKSLIASIPRKRKKLQFERTIRIEKRQTRWGRGGTSVEPEARNEVLHKAIAFHLQRVGALGDVDAARLRLMARGVEKSAGKYSWDRSFGTTSELLKQYAVLPAVPDAVMIDVDTATGLKVMRCIDDGEDDNPDEKKRGDPTTTAVDYRFYCDELAPIETFLKDAYEAYVEDTAKSEDQGRYLYVRHGGAAASTEDDDEGSSGAGSYKRYALAAHKTFESLFFPEKDKLLGLLDAFHGGRGRFAVKGSPRKLGVLLHGPPGTGKTSLIKALAERLGRNVVSIPLGRIKTNQELMDAVFDLRFDVADCDVPVKLTFKQCVFVLEDVDAASSVVHRRAEAKGERAPAPAPVAAAPPGPADADPMKAFFECLFAMDDSAGGAVQGPAAFTSMYKKPESDRLDLSGVLNVLDGVVDTPDRILIMTTNHPEALDPALIRPGRVDIQLRLGFVELPEARQMVEHYVMRRAMDAAEAAAFAGAWEARPKRDVTPADLEQVCAGCDTLGEVVAELGMN